MARVRSEPTTCLATAERCAGAGPEAVVTIFANTNNGEPLAHVISPEKRIDHSRSHG